MRFTISIILVAILSLSFARAAESVVINPTPQSITVKQGEITLPKTVRFIGKSEADAQAIQLLQSIFGETTDKKSLPVYIGEKGDKNVRRFASRIPNHAEGYYLAVEKDKIVIAGNDARGTYYAVRTLEQLIKNNSLPLVEISDFPDVADRGVVEGFYGTPWSFEDRLRQLDFYGKYKLNTYIYGPKDDPYHSSPNWRMAYPEKEAQAIRELVAAANKNHVDFVWAIHPGKDIKWTTDDRDALMRKFESMYALGVRAFAVFFDDISGEGVNAEKQAELLNYVDNNFVKPKKDVRPLIMCPTEYNKSWSDIGKGYLPTLGKNLNPTVQIMWTGDRVISDIDKQGLEWINQHIRRKAYIWWNFPVSDYVRDHLLMGPAYGLDTTVGGMMSGFMSNPMERAEASKVAIYSVADYAWNIADYKPMESWERALKAVLPNTYDSFRTFSIHNADLGANGHGYRRDESWEFKDTAREYLQAVRTQKTDKKATEAVQKEFSEMVTAANTLLRSKDNPQLIEEIKPWLIQFELQGKSGLFATIMQQALQNDNREHFRRLYDYIKVLKEQMYENSRAMNQNPYQPGVKTATLVIEPLIDSTLLAFTDQYAQKYGERLPAIANYSPHTLFTNIKQIETLPIRDLRKNISISPILEVLKMPANSYFGIEFVPAQEINRVRINIGLPQFPSWAAIQVSADGKNWTPAEGKANDKGEWTGAKQSENVRFIRLINTSDKEQECYLKTFEATGV